MGIKGLTSLIKKYAPNAMKTHSLMYFKGSKIAIDTSILIYKFRYSSNNKHNSHLSGLLQKCLTFLTYGIIPVFILDGKPPPEKGYTLAKRVRHKEKIENRIKELESRINHENKSEIIYQIKKLSKQLVTVTREHHKDVQEILDILGFTVVNSLGEAEETCASLQKNGSVEFTYTDDTDAIVLGCQKVLRSNTRSKSLIEIDLNKLLEELEITYEQFIDLCILCGCDYCPTIPKMTYTSAYLTIKKYKSIEKFLEENKFYNIPTNFDYEKARMIFKNEMNLKIIIKENPEIDSEKLFFFLSKRGFSKKFIKNYVNKFEKLVENNFLETSKCAA